MKIFAASIQTETNTFSPVPTSKTIFEETYKTFRGQDPDNPNFWGAPMVEFQKLAFFHNDEYIEGLCVAAEPAGIVPKKVYENYRDEILKDLTLHLPVDMVLLNLHGAMVAEEYDDCEGDFIHRVRNLVGKDVPIGVELDLHAHLTNKMIKYSDLIISFKLYPHTDVADRARELYSLTRKLAMKELDLYHSVFDCEMINLYPTGNTPIKEFVNEIFSVEKNDGKVISISFIHGFIWGDVPDMGSKILVYTDASKDTSGEYAINLATTLGEKLYSIREQTYQNLLTVDNFISHISRTSNGPVVAADFSDNPGLGGMGDATFILQAVLDANIRNVVFATIYDPAIVDEAFNKGVGSLINIKLGGKFGTFSGNSIQISGIVKTINPNLVQTFCGQILPLGKAAVIEAEGNFIILNSLRSQIYSPDAITNMNIELTDKKAIVVKSCEHFRANFSSIASNIVRVSTPAVGNMDIKNISYKHITRKMWPITKT